MSVPQPSIDHWFYSSVPGDDARNEAVRTALADAGILTRNADPASISGPGVFMFTTVDEACLRALAALSDEGRRRIIAIALDADPAAEHVWSVLATGASDVIRWCADGTSVADVASRLARWREVDQLVALPLVTTNLIGNSRAWRSVLRQAVEMARFTDAPILITGETGSGKELLARLVHDLDVREDKGDLVVVDCTTVVSELSGSEFFGHEKGAFTGAMSSRDGALALANGGTLYLDELGELPLGLQAQLLRAVQEGMYKRVGGNAWRRAKFRLVCATNRNLPEMVEHGTFRRDFFYRVAGNVLTIPPLRDRAEDVVPLATSFVREFRPDIKPVSFGASVVAFLESRPYPGNVRDLRQLVARMCCRHAGRGPFTPGDIPEDEQRLLAPTKRRWADGGFDRAIRYAVAGGASLKEISRAAEDAAIRIAVEREGGNLQRAACRLGVTDRTLQLRRAADRIAMSDALRG